LLNLLRFKSFIQAAATRAAWKQHRASIFKLERANRATQSVAQGPAFAPASVPLPKYPEDKNCCKEKQQIYRNQRCKGDPDHGVAGARATSLPHSIVAIPQTRDWTAVFAIVDPGEKRASISHCLACSSNEESPEELRGKQ